MFELTVENLNKCEVIKNDDGTCKIIHDFGNGYSVIYHRCIIDYDKNSIEVLKDDNNFLEIVELEV